VGGRKAKETTLKREKEKKIWSCGVYIRLSQEDIDIGESKKESNSIISQKEILTEYIKEENDLKLFDIYIDDGFTGTDFNRPSFQRMLEDIRKGNINCVIVKDLSRLGRNYIEVGKYIEQIFPIFNVRFIAINDRIDSFQNPDSINTILVPFKNLINDEYARDTSIKIRSALNGKKKRGDFVGAFPSYGYRKKENDKHKLEIDPVSAEIVQKIFMWYVKEGISKIGICHRLNDYGILNPTGYKKVKLDNNYQNYYQNETYLWTPSTIRNILSNEIYIGHMIQGKRKTKSYKLHKVEVVPKEEWIRVENTHEAIVEKEIFEKAQEISKKDIKVSQTTKELSVFAGILKCADCRHAMHKKSSSNETGKVYEYYICSTYRKKSSRLCTKHSVKVEWLKKAVLKAINTKLEQYVDFNRLKRQITENKNNKRKFGNDFNQIEKAIQEKQNEILKIKRLKKLLYEDWKNEDLSREEYLEYKTNYEADIKEIQIQIIKMEEQKLNGEKKKKEESKQIIDFFKNKKFNNLSRDLILELIDTILIHENGDITIIFQYKKEKDEYKERIK